MRIPLHRAEEIIALTHAADWRSIVQAAELLLVCDGLAMAEIFPCAPEATVPDVYQWQPSIEIKDRIRRPSGHSTGVHNAEKELITQKSEAVSQYSRYVEEAKSGPNGPHRTARVNAARSFRSKVRKMNK